MAITHKCDACKKPIKGVRTTVDSTPSYERFELCATCAVPIVAVLKKYKLITI